jgi:hypothetical protein
MCWNVSVCSECMNHFSGLCFHCVLRCEIQYFVLQYDFKWIVMHNTGTSFGGMFCLSVLYI